MENYIYVKYEKDDLYIEKEIKIFMDFLKDPKYQHDNEDIEGCLRSILTRVAENNY